MSATGDRGSGPPAAAGFTLLELLVTLGIMALIVGIGFPALQHALAHARLADAHDRVWLALVTARADARRGDAPVVLTLAPDGRRLIAEAAATPALPPGIAIDWPPQGLAFHADGTASPGTIALRGAAGAARIVVDAGTGRIADAP